MKTVAFVPIKLNSQRLPQKNLLPLMGKPLCWHVLSTLTQISAIDAVYVYCSDSQIQRYIPTKAIYLSRDKRLDGELVKGFDIYSSFIDEVDADVYVLAHTTSPFLKRESVANALSHVTDGSHDSAFSAQRLQTFAWHQGKPLNYDINDVPRTQDLEAIYIETSGFYIFRKEIFTDHNRRIGFNPYKQEVGIIEAVDIDEKDDYEFALRLAGE